jgi:hypothetical protein
MFPLDVFVSDTEATVLAPLRSIPLAEETVKTPPAITPVPETDPVPVKFTLFAPASKLPVRVKAVPETVTSVGVSATVPPPMVITPLAIVPLKPAASKLVVAMEPPLAVPAPGRIKEVVVTENPPSDRVPELTVNIPKSGNVSSVTDPEDMVTSSVDPLPGQSVATTPGAVSQLFGSLHDESSPP